MIREQRSSKAAGQIHTPREERETHGSVQGSANPRGPGSVNKRIKSCVLLPATGSRTQLFHLILIKPRPRGLADPCIARSAVRLASSLSLSLSPFCISIHPPTPAQQPQTDSIRNSFPLLHSTHLALHAKISFVCFCTACHHDDRARAVVEGLVVCSSWQCTPFELTYAQQVLVIRRQMTTSYFTKN